MVRECLNDLPSIGALTSSAGYFVFQSYVGINRITPVANPEKLARLNDPAGLVL